MVKKYISWNFTLFTPTLNVTKAIFHFCTCAKRCCVLWLPPRASSLTGDACERLHVPTHTKIKSKEFSSYRCWCSCSSWWWHSPANGCAQLTALAPTPSLHFRWLVKELLPWAVWDTTGPAPAVPTELQPHLLQLPMQPFSWRDRKERQTKYFIQNF